MKLLSKKYSLPVYTTATTLLHAGLRLQENLVRQFNAHEQILIGSISITPFPKLHDSCDPYSFIISSNYIKVGVFTDIGKACENVVNHFKQCNAAFLETNYDEEMLEQGDYPYYLKKRIKGGMGHLSNKQALDLFLKYKPSFMSHLFLSHLSKNNNCPKLVSQLFNIHAGGVQIIIASRDEAIPVYHINNIAHKTKNTKQVFTSMQQMEFSFL